MRRKVRGFDALVGGVLAFGTWFIPGGIQVGLGGLIGMVVAHWGWRLGHQPTGEQRSAS
jgi:hypothetical protein